MEEQNGLISRRILVFLLAAMALSVASCADAGKETEELYSVKVESQPTAEPVKTLDLQPAVTSIQTSDKSSGRNQKAETYQMEDWEKAYLEYLESFEGKDRCTYSFIYVDDDSIPELEINTGVSVSGSLLLTYHDGILDEVDIYRSGLYYIEKGNLVCNSSGSMGFYYDYVYTIQDGFWKQIGCGEFREDYETITEDYIDYIYEWAGESVTEEEYRQSLQNIYPEEESGEPEGHYYIYKDISSLLKAGTVASANHYYKLIKADMTWTEAEAACREIGGYLANITSWEEFERIQEQIIQEEKTDIGFWIGAMCSRERENHGFHCIEPGGDLGYDMLSHSKALWYGFWWDDEPSYNGLTEVGEEVREGFVMMRYSSDDGRYYYWDMPDDILAARPSCTGKIGYICEYDEWQE